MASARLAELIEMARQHEMTPEEASLQLRSFVWGNMHIENPDITRAMVDKVARQFNNSIGK